MCSKLSRYFNLTPPQLQHPPPTTVVCYSTIAGKAAMTLCFIAGSLVGAQRPRDSSGLTSTRARQRRSAVVTRRRPLQMVTPLPDDTAPDMLTFMLSGPAFAAWGMFFAACVALVRTFGVTGRRQGGDVTTTYVLRVRTPVALRIWVGDISREVRGGESVLTFTDASAARATTDAIEKAASMGNVKSVCVWAARFDTNGGVAAEHAVLPRVETDDKDDIDREWAQKLSQLAPLRFVRRGGEGSCKLCGGQGMRTCPRCRGAAAQAVHDFQCDCKAGVVPCEWCGGGGRAG